MYSKITQNSFYFPSRYPYQVSSTRSFSNGKQIMLPSLTPHKSSANGKNFFPGLKKQNQQEVMQKFEKIMKEKEKYSSIVKNLRLKLQKVEEIKETYGLQLPKNFHLTPKNIKKLENTAKLEKQTRIFSKAVHKIETWWKKRTIQKKIQFFNNLMDKSALVIQKCWKQFITRKKFLIAVKKMNKAAVVIQKNFRGYLVRKKYILMIRELNMTKVFDYFNEQKQKLLRESALKIWNNWKIIKKKWAQKQQKKKQLKKVLKKRRKVEENPNSFSAFPEPEPSRIPEGVERPKKNLSIKSIVQKKQLNPATPASPAVMPARLRSNTEVLGVLEPIKEVKLTKEDERKL